MAECESNGSSRVCRICSEPKPITEFYKNKNCKTGGGIDSKCKRCHAAIGAKNQKSETAKVYKSRWAAEKWRTDAEYKLRKQKCCQEFFKKPEPLARYAVKKKLREASKVEYYKALRKKQYERRRQRPGFLSSASIRSRIRECLKAKKSKTFNILGYTSDELVKHLEKQFLPGMSWSNFGAWHIDHIVPLSSLKIVTEEDAKKAWCLSNLRPLWAVDNLKKHAKRTHLI